MLLLVSNVIRRSIFLRPVLVKECNEATQPGANDERIRSSDPRSEAETTDRDEAQALAGGPADLLPRHAHCGEPPRCTGRHFGSALGVSIVGAACTHRDLGGEFRVARRPPVRPPAQ